MRSGFPLTSIGGACGERGLTDRDAEAVQRRREFPAKVTQAAQLAARRGMAHIFNNPGPIEAHWQAEVITRIPGIHRALGYAVGMGVRPEHVRDARQPAERGASRLWAAPGIAAGVAACGLAARKLVRRG